MSRLRNYKASLLTSYGVIAAQVLCAFCSIPLALHFLPGELFGLWALILQVSLFFQFIDVGFSEAFVRILIDYKANSGALYRSVIKTAVVVFAAQGVVVLILAAMLARFLPPLLELDAAYWPLFRALFVAQALAFCLGNVTRIFEQILFANQRLDLSNIVSMIALPFSLIVLGTCFVLGAGIWSLFLSSVALVAMSVILRARYCLREGFVDRAMLAAPFRGVLFREIFSYGKDRFLATIGDRTLRMVPSLLITRLFGLGANAVWAVANRPLLLAEQILTKPMDMAYPALSEMYVRDERDRLTHRYPQVVELTAACAGVATCAIATCAAPAVYLWTAGKMELPRGLAPGFALWFAILILKRTLWPVVTIPKSMGWARLTNFADLGLLGLLSLLFLDNGSPLWLVAVCVAAATLGTSIPYMMWRAGRFPRRQASRDVLARYRLLVVGLCGGLLAWIGQDRFVGPAAMPQLSYGLLATVLVGFGIAWNCGDLRPWLGKLPGLGNWCRRMP